MNGLTINEFKPTYGKCDSGKLQERTNTESKCNIERKTNTVQKFITNNSIFRTKKKSIKNAKTKTI